MRSLAADHEEPGVPENLEVMRHRGLRDGKKFSDLTTGQLTGRRQLLDRAKPSRLRQGLQNAQQDAVIHNLVMVHGLPMGPGVL